MVGKAVFNLKNFSFPFNSSILTVKGNVALNAVAMGLSSSVAVNILVSIVIFISLLTRFVFALSAVCVTLCMPKAMIVIARMCLAIALIRKRSRARWPGALTRDEVIISGAW